MTQVGIDVKCRLIGYDDARLQREQWGRTLIFRLALNTISRNSAGYPIRETSQNPFG
jgi:hypothetical protein